MMQNSFEFADAQPPDEMASAAAAAMTASSEKVGEKNLMDDSEGPSSRRSTITVHPTTLPFLSLATFRMVVLADELLESFFSEDLARAWHLEPLTEEVAPPKPTGAAGMFTSFVGSFMTDDNKDYLAKLADDIGKRLDIQHVEQKPSLGRLTGAAAMLEPLERTTLLSTSKKSPTKSNQTSPLLGANDPLSAASMRQPVYLPPPSPQRSPSLSEGAEKALPDLVVKEAEEDLTEKSLPDAPKDKVLGLGIMDERPRFSIDVAVEDDEDLIGDEEVGVDDDAALMNGKRQKVATFFASTCLCELYFTDVDAFLSSMEGSDATADAGSAKGESQIY